MTPQVKRRTFALLVLAGVMLPSELLLLPAFDVRAGCVRDAEWVAQHEHVLPTTLAEIAAFPRHYRPRIFVAIPAIDKASMWREQYRAFLGSHRSLTPQQVQTLEHAIDITTPELYLARGNAGAPPEGAETTAIRLLGQKFSEQFAGEDLASLLVLGEGITPANSVSSFRVNLIESLRTRFVAQAAGYPCDCAFDNECWGGSYSCIMSGCDPQLWGCGPGGWDECWGWCF